MKIESKDIEKSIFLSKIFVVASSLEILFGPVGFYKSALCEKSNFVSALLFLIFILFFFYSLRDKNHILYSKYDGLLIIGFILLLFIYSDAYEPRFNYYTTFLLAISSFCLVTFHVLKYKKIINFILYLITAIILTYISANFSFNQRDCMSSWYIEGFPSTISLTSSARMGYVFYYPINYITNFLFYLALLYMISFLYNYKTKKYKIINNNISEK